MGAALGAALVLPWGAALAVFGGLGLGIALPFLLLGFVPAFRRRLPKPGAWMETLRHILAVPMFLTALGLAWVLGRQAGIDGMTIGLGAALLASFGLWWVGLRQRKGRSWQWLPALPLLLAAVATVALVKRHHDAASAQATGVEPFSEARLAELTAQGRPVFAYFTADWCLTCKVNEKAVIETDAVARALAEGKVAVLVGDWTDGDPVLGRFIEKHNRAGVPLYLWYKPGQAEPQVLPQILTQAMLQDLAGGR
jgi:thiol:disulfide interchange protein